MVCDRISIEDADLFKEIMSKERLIRKEWCFDFFHQHQPNHIYQDVIQILEVARSSTIPRVFLNDYNVYKGECIYESTSAHANLFKEVFTRALDDFEYCANTLDDSNSIKKIIANEVKCYSKDEMYAAITLHDLPENEIGDYPDNESCDVSLKHQQEYLYCTDYVKMYARKDSDFGKHVLELIQSMGTKDSLVGQLLYLADKTSAVLNVLSYDHFNIPVLIHTESPHASRLNLAAMERCDYHKDGYYRASEMWTIDFFELRQFCQYDRTGYFTALIIMYTIIVHRKWYAWRKSTYAEYHHKLDNP